MKVINIIITIGNAALLAHAIKIKLAQEGEWDGSEMDGLERETMERVSLERKGVKGLIFGLA
jgi:hypothetical protein